MATGLEVTWVPRSACTVSMSACTPWAVMVWANSRSARLAASPVATIQYGISTTVGVEGPGTSSRALPEHPATAATLWSSRSTRSMPRLRRSNAYSPHLQAVGMGRASVERDRLDRLDVEQLQDVVALKGGQDPEPLVTRAMLQLSPDVAVVVHHRRRRWRPGRLVQSHRGRLVPERRPSLTGRIGWQGHGPPRHRVRQPAKSSRSM